MVEHANYPVCLVVEDLPPQQRQGDQRYVLALFLALNQGFLGLLLSVDLRLLDPEFEPVMELLASLMDVYKL